MITTRIVFLITSPFPCRSGGIENWLHNLLHLLDKRGIETVVISQDSRAKPFYDLSRLKRCSLLRVKPMPFYRQLYTAAKRISPAMSVMPYALAMLWWTLLTYRALRKVPWGDVLVVLQPLPGMLPVMLSRLTGRRGRVICSVRGRVGADLAELGHRTLARVYQRLERFSLRFADLVASNGYDTAAYVQRELGRESVVLPNGVDWARFAYAKADLDDNHPGLATLRALAAGGAKIIMTVATLRDIKGIRYLIEATARLNKIYPDPFSVAFVGKGDPTDYRILAEKLGVGELVLFLGEQNDVPSFLHLADVAVAISGGGGVAMAAIEMMAAGKPVVAWDNPTYRQLIAHGWSGHLVQDRDAEALAEGLQFVLQNPAYASMIASNAQEAAKAYDWEVIAERFAQTVHSVASGD